jgi:hypothetical protein
LHCIEFTLTVTGSRSNLNLSRQQDIDALSPFKAFKYITGRSIIQ